VKLSTHPLSAKLWVGALQLFSFTLTQLFLHATIPLASSFLSSADFTVFINKSVVDRTHILLPYFPYERAPQATLILDGSVYFAIADLYLAWR